MIEASLGSFCRCCAMWLLAVPSLLVGFSSASAAPPDAGYVAYVERVLPAQEKLSDAAKVRRNGVFLRLDRDTVDLLPGDQIFVTDKNATILVRMIASNSVIPIQRSKSNAAGTEPDMMIPRPALHGLSGAVLAWLKGALSGADQSGTGSTMTSSRAIGQPAAVACYNETGKTDDPTPFDMPAMHAVKSKIVSGHRSLFISWRGGASPFSIVLSNADTGEVLARADHVERTCSVRLQAVQLRQGRVKVAISDVNNVLLHDDDIYVTDALPPMPVELDTAGLSDETRELYFDTWLASKDGGTWALEAQQRAASLACKSDAAREWLAQWGGAPACGR